MNRLVNAIVGRLSLRPPQRKSLEILDRICEIAPPAKSVQVAAALSTIKGEFPTVTDFERAFPSLCFAIATGVGKTRLMGAFITYLHLARGVNNFFVLAPNLTIYNKLIADFTPNTSKYVFTGISEFAVEAPAIITGDNYEGMAGTLFDRQQRCKINIFNISKIDSEVRGGRAPRIKRLSEYIGESYFDYLAGLPDLVLLMDESHRYRARAGMRAINELNPIMGLELTATPFTESNRGPVPFKNVIYSYPLGNAIADGFVKDPAVVTRKDFNPHGMSPDEIERMKLHDGVRLHEGVKVELETYARESDRPIVKPFLLVIARDTTHAAQLLQLIESDEFFSGLYRGKAIQVDSSQRGAAEDQMVERLLRVEHADEPTEIVIHVNMLKEGWDVTNLYTIVPLRAANARTLVEQSIGRGLRLPYGLRTRVRAVDRLNIVAHDKFQEIVDDSRRPDSPIRLQAIELEPEQLDRRTVTVVSPPNSDLVLGLVTTGPDSAPIWTENDQSPVNIDPIEVEIARVTAGVIREFQRQPDRVPLPSALSRPEIQAEILRRVNERLPPTQTVIGDVVAMPDVAAVVARTIEATQQTIPIPRISVAPTGEVRSGYRPFELEVGGINYQPPSGELIAQSLQSGRLDQIALGDGSVREARPEDYVVRALINYDDIDYDAHADLLYEFAGKAFEHVSSYMSAEDATRVLAYYGSQIAGLIHAQMERHYVEEATSYEVKVSQGFTPLKQRAYAQEADLPLRNFRLAPPNLSEIGRYLFGGFERCLYPSEKFQSNAERILSIILDRESQRWFRPAKGQFLIYYRLHGKENEYQPDFVAETEDVIYMLEPKRRSDLETDEVVEKKRAAVEWCGHASEYTARVGGKPWKYLLIPHDVIAENMTLTGLASGYVCSES